jgi:RNA polymerase subunit RPABC4/transcription elongation factor Spt4
MDCPNKKCPFCGSTETEKQSDFGTTIMVKQHYCRNCRTVFEWVKWGDDDPTLDLPEFLKNSHKKSKIR